MGKVIITIARQYGSGGREIGEMIAKELDVPFYDQNLITLAAEKSNLCHEAAAEADERNANSLLYTLAMGSTAMLHSTHYNMPINDKLFLVQSDIIKEAAQKGSCVVVGRCADYVLRDRTDVISVFIHADANTLPSATALPKARRSRSSPKLTAAAPITTISTPASVGEKRTNTTSA